MKRKFFNGPSINSLTVWNDSTASSTGDSRPDAVNEVFIDVISG
jgi:hypothetical protein